MTLRAALLALAVMAGPAGAQQCGPRAAMVAELATRYDEARVGIGLAGNGQGAVEVYASAQSRTWTITLTRPDGMLCLIASGEAWETFPAAPPGVPG